MRNMFATTGFNSKQLWVVDDDNGTYIDPPKAVLDEIDKRFDYWDWESKKEALDKIIETNPDWLYDEEYTYSMEEYEI